MGTTSSKKKPTSNVESSQPAVVEPEVVEPADVKPANWYKEKENKKVVIDKIDEISQNTTVKLEGGLFLKLLSRPHIIQLAITKPNNDPLIIGTVPSPDNHDDTHYKSKFKKIIEDDMEQTGGKKKTRRNQKTKKYRKNRRKTNRRKK
jgi:hypothetical protein